VRSEYVCECECVCVLCEHSTTLGAARFAEAKKDNTDRGDAGKMDPFVHKGRGAKTPSRIPPRTTRRLSRDVDQLRPTPGRGLHDHRMSLAGRGVGETKTTKRERDAQTARPLTHNRVVRCV
jgi:hypothetical protein